ncbi:hypothetical protein BgiMline_007911 [Biomphalaria glabrata]|uniref:Uncharacterized protein LOC106056971 n=1 Tax=Biomphalaria glabrata TaxID=6526 RepID=A0A9W3A0E6_BIOGL|nr:uncharacterized protein LOC106056971 [Biomphalaria glabrata]XP_055880806.1 uncharacterized protein LOC106056971 [Biomphalaria glabrata]XP_055880807.1 uncharacterized protein LOC106056971 [Biomphalaria glabrata]XP_055880808.1 uncharacterized protein LOC106056971 [Biomphalaria glabrata]XP_055880809.1 uncharacterized protein LOC106056971 [Biomphalaria glabrata]KAI8746891.1 monocarboxylate transporter 3 [Biomphalaria glabrata]
MAQKEKGESHQDEVDEVNSELIYDTVVSQGGSIKAELHMGTKKGYCSSDIDGGYGWVIVLASFFNAFVIDGIGSSFGLLLPYMKDKYGASDFLMSFANSLFMAFLIMGTVSVHLTNKFGVRLVTVIGGFIACVSFIGSAYVNNVFVFILLYGLLAGCGCGLVFLPSIIIVNAYFHNWRGIANGIISAGSGAGLVVLSPLIKYLIENYTLEGTILILSGIMLNMCVFSSLYRPPPSLEKNSSQNSNSSSCSLSLDNLVHVLDSVTEQNETIVDKETNYYEEATVDCDKLSKLEGGDANHDTKLTYLVQKHLKSDPPSNVNKKGFHRLIALNKSDQKSPWKSEYQLRSEADHSDHSFHSSVYNLPTWYNASHQGLILRKKVGGKHNRKMNAVQHLSPQEWAADNGSQLYLAGSIATLRSLQQRHVHSHLQVPAASQQFSSLPKFRFSSSDLPVDQPESKQQAKNNIQTRDQSKASVLSDHQDGLKQLTTGHLSSDQSNLLDSNIEKNNNSEDVVQSGHSLGQLLCLPSFHLFSLGASLIQIGYPIASTFLANYAKQLEPSSNTALLMSLLGAMNICGRCLAGLLVSFRVDPFHLNNISLLLVGLSCLLTPIYQEFWTLCLFSAFYGFFLGFFPPLQPLIIVKQFGIGSLATAFGFLTTIKGLASFPGAPLAGWINDETGNYALSFVFGGTVFFLSGLVHYLMMCVKK